MEKKNYSSEELQEFKILLTKKLTKAEEEYKLLLDSISRKDNSASDTNWSSHKLEDGQATLTNEENNIFAQKQLKFIEALKGALLRIENKSYGICFKTGQLIPKERLLAVPHTTVTINNKNNYEKQESIPQDHI